MHYAAPLAPGDQYFLGRFCLPCFPWRSCLPRADCSTAKAEGMRCSSLQRGASALEQRPRKPNSISSKELGQVARIRIISKDYMSQAILERLVMALNFDTLMDRKGLGLALIPFTPQAVER